MDREALAQQAAIEHQALAHVMQALSTALDWQTGSGGTARKFSSVRFMAQSFERHLRRMMALEEDGGYMQIVTECKPNLASKVAPLAADHRRFSQALDQLMDQFRAAESSGAPAEATYQQLASLVADVDRHNRSEAALVQQVLVEDLGGEG